MSEQQTPAAVTPGADAVETTLPTATAKPTETPTLTSAPIPTVEPTSTLAPTNTPEHTVTPTATPTRNALALLDLGPLLEDQDPEAADVVRALPWVANGVDAIEIADLGPWLNVALERPKLFGDLIDKLWVRYGITFPDSGVIRYLDSLAKASPGNAELILEQHLLAPGDPERFTMAKTVRKLSDEDSELIRMLLGEASVERVVQAVTEFSWVSDGLLLDEIRRLASLLDIAQSDVKLLFGLVDRSWVRNGISYEDRGSCVASPTSRRFHSTVPTSSSNWHGR